MTTVEPVQFAEKSVVIREQTQPIYLEGYHRPSYRDPDDAVYDAISDILSNGRVSRFYRSLVEQQQIAAEAVGESPVPGEKYPSLFLFGAVPLPGHTPAEMRDAIHKEIEKLKTADVTDAELQMYKTRTRAELLRSLNDNQGLATSLADYQTRYGDWRELFQQLDQVDKVTKADISPRSEPGFCSPPIEPALKSTRGASRRPRETRWRRAMKIFYVKHSKLGAPRRNEKFQSNTKLGAPGLDSETGESANDRAPHRCRRMVVRDNGRALRRPAIQALGTDSCSAAPRLPSPAAQAHRAKERRCRLPAGRSRVAVHLWLGAHSRRLARRRSCQSRISRPLRPGLAYQRHRCHGWRHHGRSARIQSRAN